LYKINSNIIKVTNSYMLRALLAHHQAVQYLYKKIA